MFVPAESVDAFLAAPAGCYVRGEHWLYLCVDARLFVQVYWGRPTSADVGLLMSAWQAELAPGAVQHAGLVDASHLDTIDPESFALMGQELVGNAAVLGTKLERQALVRPAGLTGMQVAGFYEVLKPSYPVQLFAEVAPALAWLGRGEVADAVVALAAEARSDGELVGRLKHHLAATLSSATLTTAARALAISERTLQRRLQQDDLSFQQILMGVRVSAAEALLRDTDRKLADIAAAVGFASAQHFTDVFRRVHGVAPSSWRRR